MSEGTTATVSCIPKRKHGIAPHSAYPDRTGDMRVVVVMASELEDTQNRVVYVVSGDSAV